MTDTPPPIEYQREALNAMIKQHRNEYWQCSTLAKSYKKAGLADAAKKQAEASAGLERVVDALEAELKALK